MIFSSFDWYPVLINVVSLVFSFFTLNTLSSNAAMFI